MRGLRVRWSCRPGDPALQIRGSQRARRGAGRDDGRRGKSLGGQGRRDSPGSPALAEASRPRVRPGALLAQALAESLGVRARLRGLRRLRNTPSQVDLPYAESGNATSLARSRRGVWVVRVVCLSWMTSARQGRRSSSIEGPRRGGSVGGPKLRAGGSRSRRSHVKYPGAVLHPLLCVPDGVREAEPVQDPLDYLRIGVDPSAEADALINDLRAHGFEIGRRIDEADFVAFDAVVAPTRPCAS